MNIFVLDQTPELCAKAHCDKHVSKMVLETAQLLSTCHRTVTPTDFPPEAYRCSHLNHPCSVFVRDSASNYRWTFELFRELAAEFQRRYQKVHLSWQKLGHILTNPPKGLVDVGLTPFRLCMPDQFKVEGDAVQSYRNYYNGAKQHFAKWEHSPVPDWWNPTNLA